MSKTYVTGAGEEAFLDLLTAVNYTVRLFINDVTAGLTPTQVEALTAADFTEATFPGYAAAPLTGGSWVTTQDDPSTATYAAQMFTRSATGTAQAIYGFYVVTTTGGNLRWFEMFDGPIIVTDSGDAISVTPRLTLDDGEDSDMSARGVVAYHEETDSDGPYTTDSVTDLAIANVPVVAGRLYAVHLHMEYNMSAAGTWLVAFRVNGAMVDRFWRIEDEGTTLLQDTIDATVYWAPAVTASTDDIDVYLDEISGSGGMTLTGTPTVKRTLTVIDVGLA